jgi:Phage integrase family/Family of unknown function (DUF6262)
MHRRLPITTETAEVVMAWERHRSRLPTPPAIRHWLFPSPQLRAKQAHGHVTAVCVGGALERLDAADRPDRRRAPRSRRAAPFDRSRVTPSALRHSCATALVNAGVSLQALIALLGHVSAAMSLRYARLFDATVQTEYERALGLAKSHIGPLPAGRPGLPLVDVTGGADWKAAPALKTRLAGGFCLRARARRLPLRQHLRALPELPHRQHASARAHGPTPGRASARGRRRSPRLDRGGRPAPPPDRPTRRRPGPSRQHTTEPTLVRVERACAQLLQAHQQVTFTAVAQLAGIARATLYRDPELRAVIDEHRTRQAEARTLSGLAHEIAHLRTALEAVAENVRRHEERLRRLKRRTGRQTG